MRDAFFISGFQLGVPVILASIPARVEQAQKRAGKIEISSTVFTNWGVLSPEIDNTIEYNTHH